MSKSIIEEKQVLIKGVKSNYKIAGEGTPLLILHGWGIGCSDYWVKIQKVLAVQGYQVIVPDFPGFGESEKPPTSWNVTNYMEWLVDFINFLNLDKFHLIAHSFGARIAIKLSVNYPEKIDKLVLCGPAGIRTKPSFKVWLINILAETGNSSFDWKYLRKFKGFIRTVFYCCFMRKKDYAVAKGVMKEILRKVIGEDLSSYFPKIKTKTLILWGEKDGMVPDGYADIFLKKIENSE